MRGSRNLLLYFLLGILPLVLVLVLVMVSPALGEAKWITMLIGILVAANLGRFTWSALVLGFLFLKLQWLKRHPALTEYGVRPPVCGACGYDLRASPEHCPECGTRVGGLDATIVRYLMSLRRRDMIEPPSQPAHRSVRRPF